MKELTIKRDKTKSLLTIEGYIINPNEKIVSEIRINEDKIKIWDPVYTPGLAEAQIIIKGSDGRLMVDAKNVGNFKDGIPFPIKLEYDLNHYIEIHAPGYVQTHFWKFSEGDPLIEGTDRPTYMIDISTLLFHKMSSYLDRYSNLTIEVNPSHASIVFIRTKDDKKFPFLSTQPIELDDNEGKGAEYTLLITAMGYRTYSKKKIYKNKTITKTDERLTPANDGQNKLTIQLEEK